MKAQDFICRIHAVLKPSDSVLCLAGLQ